MTMIIEMTHAQLLQEWRLRYLHEPVNDDCPYTRHVRGEKRNVGIAGVGSLMDVVV